MKWFFKIALLSILLQSFQCTDTIDASGDITSTQLETKKQEIQNYINSFSCSESVGCSFIAFGSKPCGGPRSYLLFSNSVDLTKLQAMVKTYNDIDELYSIQTNAISDCMYCQQPKSNVSTVFVPISSKILNYILTQKPRLNVVFYFSLFPLLIFCRLCG